VRIPLVTLSGEPFEVDIPACAKLKDLRDALCTQYSDKPKCFELLLGERILKGKKDHCFLSDLGVSQKQCLTAVKVFQEQCLTEVTVVKKQCLPAVNMCLFNTAFLKDDLAKVIREIRIAQENAPENEPLLNVVSYFHAAAETRQRWSSIFMRRRLDGVCQQYVLPEGVLILCCNVTTDDACPSIKFSMHIYEMPDDFTCDSFSMHSGGLVCHMKVCMKYVFENEHAEDVRFYNLDVLWTFYLAGSKEGFLPNDKAMGDAIGLLHKRRMFGEHFTEFSKAREEYCNSVDGCIMVTHVYNCG